MKELIIKKWNWNNGTDFANWISGEITDKVLAEFWYWYRDLKKKVSDLSDSDHEDVVLAEIGELSFEGLSLPTLDTKFSICGKEFEVRDALSPEGFSHGLLRFLQPLFQPPLHNHRTKI